MKNEPDQICAAFNAVINLALALGVREICKMPECWEHRVDEHWTIAVNGHNEPKFAEQTTSGKTEVPPFHCYVEFNGFPAGLISPYDGILCAGSVANENAFIAALEKAAERAKRSENNYDEILHSASLP
jgi:hypothetical protein